MEVSGNQMDVTCDMIDIFSQVWNSILFGLTFEFHGHNDKITGKQASYVSIVLWKIAVST